MVTQQTLKKQNFLQIPKFSQLFHHNNDQMDLRDLQPGSTYTVDLVFITHENQTTKVTNNKPITFTTLPEEGLYPAYAASL